MVLLNKVVYSIRHILKAIKDDSHIVDYHLIDLINNNRAALIIEQYRRTRVIDPQWAQAFRDETLTQVAAGDIPNFTGYSTYKFGKITFPGIINGPYKDFGVLSFGSTSNWKRFYSTTFDQLALMIEVNDLSLQSFIYYVREGDSFYVFNYFGKVNANLLLNDPLQGYRYRTEFVQSGQILPDENYIVDSGYAFYNNAGYPKGSIFVGIEDMTEFTGTAKILYANKKKKLTWEDPYPMDAVMAREVILNVLTKEFQIERQSLMDVINDSSDTLELLKGVLTR